MNSETALVSRKKYELEPCGIQWTQPKLSFEEWAGMGAWLEAVEVGVQWWIGDWLIFGEEKFGEQFAQAIEQTGWQIKTINQYRWVCERVPFKNRRADLSFFHHREVAGMPVDEQAAWLKKAADANGEGDQWSTDRLRQELNAGKYGDKARFFVVVEAKDPGDAEGLLERMRGEGRKAKIQEKTPKTKEIDGEAVTEPADPTAPRLVKGKKTKAPQATEEAPATF